MAVFMAVWWSISACVADLCKMFGFGSSNFTIFCLGQWTRCITWAAEIGVSFPEHFVVAVGVPEELRDV